VSEGELATGGWAHLNRGSGLIAVGPRSSSLKFHLELELGEAGG
jgi:hypothetical protein